MRATEKGAGGEKGESETWIEMQRNERGKN